MLPGLIVIIHLTQSDADVGVTRDGFIKPASAIVIALREPEIPLFGFA